MESFTSVVSGPHAVPIIQVALACHIDPASAIVEISGPQPEARVLRILTMARVALAEAHATGLIHRDLKPANIMLCTQGGERDVVKLLDFGLVKELTVDVDPGLSVAGSLTGTPLYMAPESILAPDSVDARTDLYALGAVAYFLLAGREVFAGNSLVEVCSGHLHQTPEPLVARGVKVSPEIEAVVLACLEKKPERRPQSATEVRRRLEACTIKPWGADQASAWWAEHLDLIDRDSTHSVGGARAIAIAGRSRPEITLGTSDL